jgi:hypothetical protein
MSANLLMGLTTGTTMGLDIYQGVVSQRIAENQAQSMRDQISLVRAESEADIARYAEQAKDFKAKQKLAYLKSGVQLSGSPLDILDETVRVGSENINAMRAKAEAKVSGIRAGASEMEAKGRAALIAGFGNATKTMISQYGKMAGSAKPKRTIETSDSQRVTNLGFGSRARGRGSLDLY